MTSTQWRSFVALGDAATEGLGERAAGGLETALGWADRLARILDGNARLSGGAISYTNLATRGCRVADVVDRQVPEALALAPELASVMIGGNDLMSPLADPDELAGRVDSAVAALRASGADVLLATCFDLRLPFFLKPLRGRVAVFNSNLWSIARSHKTFTLDAWGLREFQNPAMWTDDRTQPSAAGHRLLSRKAAHVLGIPYFELDRTLAPPR